MACTIPAVGDATDAYFQCLIDEASDGDTIVIPTREYILDGLNVTGNDRQIRINKSLTINFNGSLMRFRATSPPGSDLWRKGFLVAPVVPRREYSRVVFQNGRFVGDLYLDPITQQVDNALTFRNNFGPILTSTSGIQIGLFEIESCVFQNLSAGVNFSSYASGTEQPPNPG